MQIDTIEQFEPLYNSEHPNYGSRYLVFYGGRGGRKSWEVARALLLRSLKAKLLILCTREVQLSITDSVHRLLSSQIDYLGIANRFEVQKNRIIADNGSEFIFKGLNSITADSLKSLEGVDICWVEEAHSVSQRSWDILIPTIRKEGSQIFASFNPDLITDPVYKMFVDNKHPNAYVAYVNYLMNENCPQTLIDEANYLMSVDPEAYAHIWLGEVWHASDAQVFKGKYRVEAFDEAELGHPLQGVDWGFAVDPIVMIRCYVNDNKLYIRSEAYRVKCEITDIPALFEKIEDSKQYLTRADNSRPELISYVGQYFRMQAAKKWNGCVYDRIMRMRAFEQIIIHPDCIHTIEEMRLYSFKKDKRTDDILPELEDKHNHCIDAIGYAIEPFVSPDYSVIPKKHKTITKI